MDAVYLLLTVYDVAHCHASSHTNGDASPPRTARRARIGSFLRLSEAECYVSLRLWHQRGASVGCNLARPWLQRATMLGALVYRVIVPMPDQCQTLPRRSRPLRCSQLQSTGRRYDPELIAFMISPVSVISIGWSTQFRKISALTVEFRLLDRQRTNRMVTQLPTADSVV